MDPWFISAPLPCVLGINSFIPFLGLCCLKFLVSNPEGSLMIYMSTFSTIATCVIGRVFSGTVKTGQTVIVMRPDYVPGASKTKELLQTSIKQLCIVTNTGTMVLNEDVSRGDIGL